MTSLNEFQQGTADWRGSVRRNQRRSYAVIVSFVLIYVFLGLMIDVLLYSDDYVQASSARIFHALVTGQLVPWATLTALVIALVSLLITYAFYNRIMLLGTQYYEVNPSTARGVAETQLYNVVEEMRIAAGLRYMPKVYLIDADYMNAFATGYSERSATVAITRGLLEKLDRDELTAVMAHELSHIRHLDIKLTLTASVLANLLLIVVDLLFYNVVFGRRREKGGAWVVIVILLRYVMPFITILLLLYLSRRREYMADAGCVELMRDNAPLARALLKIEADHTMNKSTYGQAYRDTAHEGLRRQAYIFDPIQAGIEARHSLSEAFSTHPGIMNRLRAIGFKPKD